MEETKERNGLAIAFITDGMVPAKWMMRMMDEIPHGIPAGMFWKYVWYEGKGYKEKSAGYAQARNIVVKQAKELNVKYIMWLDSVPGYTPIMVRDPLTKEIDFMPIEEICIEPEFTEENIRGIKYAPLIGKDIEVRDAKNRWTRIKKVIKHPFKGTLSRINTKGGLIDISKNHAVFKQNKRDGPVNVCDLVVGDKLAMPMINPRIKKQLFVGDKDLAWLMGYMVADGSTSKRDFSVASKSKKIINKCKKIFQKCFKTYKSSYNISVSNKVYRLGCSNKAIVEYLNKTIYTTKHKKKIPKQILNSPTEIKKAFLDGFHEGDGSHLSHTNKEYKSFTKDSQTLFAGLIYLLKAVVNTSYNIIIRDDKPKVITIKVNKHKDKWKKKDKGEIKKIKDIPYEGDLYDLSTKSEKFCGGVGNFLLHNTDVFASPSVITDLMATGKDIVTGIYYMKSMPPQPVIFKKMGDGPYWNFPADDVFEIEGSGMGCCLESMKVYDAFDKAGIPYFKENWTYTKPDGSKVRVKIGEDHWHFIKAKELGFQPYCNSAVLCDHLDVRTGAIFPGQEECDKQRKRILKKRGRLDIIEKEDKLFNLDKDKKTIVFYNATPAEFSGDELEKRGVGGSEGDIINLAKLFAKHFNVVVFCNCPKPGVYDNVHYVHAKDTEFMKQFKTDLFIASRNTQLLSDVDFKKMFKVDKVCLWTHDLPESYVFDKLMQALPNIDRIFTLTDWHRKTIQKKFPNVPDKYWFKARNGVDNVFFSTEGERNMNKLIYTSTPFRGLDVLLDVFPRIKAKVPTAELHVFSSMKVYGKTTAEKEDSNYDNLYEKARNMEGVVYHGSVIRKELAKHYREAAVLAYPCTYLETQCISASQSIVAGTPIVTSNSAALPETVPSGCGVLINGDPRSHDYQVQFVNEVVKLMTDKQYWTKRHDHCLNALVSHDDLTWETISKEWVKEFFPEEVIQYQENINKTTIDMKNVKVEKVDDVVNQETKIVICSQVGDDSNKTPEGYSDTVTVKCPRNCKECNQFMGTLTSPAQETPEQHRRRIGKEKGWEPTLVEYREKQGGNLNTPEYWDNQYKYEFENKIEQRKFVDRWDHVLDEINDNDVILDYGCGLGFFLRHVKEHKPSVKRYGIDISTYAINKAVELDSELRATNSKKGLPIDIQNKYFNVLTCFHVIEHVDDPVKFINEELRPLLAKDGKLILAIPINDDEWIEHQKVWQIEDVIELLGKFDCEYTLKHFKETNRVTKDGKPVEEMVAVVKFKD